MSRLVISLCVAMLPAIVTAQTVQQLVSLALERNPDLLAARQRTSEVQGLLLQSGLRPNPSLETGVTGGGESEYRLGYSQTIELGGKRERRLETGRLRLDLTKLLIADRERQCSAEVKAKFGEALVAMRNLESVERLLELNQQSLRIAAARTQQGEGAPIEQALIQVDVNRMQTDRLLLANQVERALLELRTLTGMRLDEPLEIRGNLQAPDVTVQLAEALKRALAERPDLAAARLEENLGEAELRLARAEAVPDLVASGQYSRATTRFDQLRDTDSLVTAGVTITLPTRNRNQGNIQAAAARRRAASLRTQGLEQVVRREVEAAVGRYTTARRAAQFFDEGVVRQSEDNLRVLRGAYDLGELRLLDVINEQRRLVETQRQYAEILKESYIALVELECAVAAPLF